MTAVGETMRCDALIDGEPTRPGGTFDDVDPATGEVLAEVARCGAAEVDSAVAAARRVFERDWSRRAPSERADVLQRVAGLIRRDHEGLAQVESRDTGKPISQARADVTI